MVPVRVLGVGLGGGQPVLLLTPVDAGGEPRLVLPIWIGEAEAVSIRLALEGEEPPRPLSHDLMRALLDAVGATVERVDVVAVERGAFLAELHVATPSGRLVLDCRPSDAIALATRTGAPLFVAEQVLGTAGVREDGGEADDDPDEPDLDEFRRFLDDIEPDDFRG